MPKDVRIIERKMPDGKIVFIIQQRHFLFRFWWIDAFMPDCPYCTNSFDTLAESIKNLCYYDGSKPVDQVVA